MPHITVQAAVVVLLTLATGVKTETGEVTFWNKDVTIKCPEDSKVYAKDGAKPIHEDMPYTFEYKQEVYYECKDRDNKKTYSFYIKGRVCENCFELSGNFFLVIIVVDLFGSAVVMMLIYKCSKKKSSDGPSKPTKATPKTGGRAPPVPSPDYESLNIHTLASDTYSSMNTGMVNRMG